MFGASMVTAIVRGMRRGRGREGQHLWCWGVVAHGSSGFGGSAVFSVGGRCRHLIYNWTKIGLV